MNTLTKIFSKGFAVLLLACALGCIAPASSFAVTSSEKQAEADAAWATLESMRVNLDITSNRYYTAIAEHDAAIAARDDAQARIDAATQQILDTQYLLGQRVRGMYRNGNDSFVDFLLGSSSFQDFVNNWDLLASLNESDEALVQQTKDLRAEIEEEKAELERQEQLAAQKEAEALAAKTEAENTTAAMQAIYESLSAEAAMLLAQEEAAAEAARQAELQRVIAEQVEAGEIYYDDNAGGWVYTGNGGSIVDNALAALGVGYEWGGSDMSGFDCSGLVSWCYGYDNHAFTSYSLYALPDVGEPQPGDVIACYEHVGIYVGDGMVIHAPTFGSSVSYISIDDFASWSHSDGYKVVRP